MKPPWLVIAAFVVLAVLGGYSIQRADDRQGEAFRAYQLEDCVSTLGARDDVIERDENTQAREDDMRYFATVAAAARRKDGEHEVARKYVKIANRADHRSHNAEARIIRAKDRSALGLDPKVALRLDYKDRCLKAWPELRP